MEKKYRALRFVGTVFRIIGIVLGVITILGALGFCASSILGGVGLESLVEQMDSDLQLPGVGMAAFGIVMGVVMLIYGGISAISTYAIGDVIYILIDIEANTRKAAEKTG
jgi:hypothetical protein